MNERLDDLHLAVQTAAQGYFSEANSQSELHILDLTTKEDLAAGIRTTLIRRREAKETLAAKTFGA